MSVRSNWCEYDKETRKYIKKRDKDRCVICGSKGALQIMHIFLNRSHGGKGCKENGVLGCIKCHSILDNPIGEEQNKLSQEYKAICMQYLFNKENIIYNDEFIKSLKFDKQRYIDETEPNIKSIQKKKYNRCKDCKMLVKRNSFNNTISSYYCKYRKINLNKTTKACDKFKKRLGKS
jgi:hypothetical protein